MKLIPKVLAILILFVLYAFTTEPTLNNDEQKALASDFGFERRILHAPSDVTPVFIRDVHPQYQRFCTWISSIGAAISFFDLDNDRLYNDIVHVDPRFDKVLISPVEKNSTRYLPFELAVKQLPYSAKTMAPSGVLTYDFNEDGKTDVLVYYLGRSPIIFYQTENGYEEYELDEHWSSWNSSTGTVADINGDGHADILIGNYFPDETKLLDAEATDKSQVMQHSMSRGDNGGRNRLFVFSGLNNGKAIFKEEKNWLEGLDYPYDWTLAVAACDLTGDLLPELYIANDFGPDKLLYNKSKDGKVSFSMLKGERKITTIRSNVVGKDSFKGMGVDFADINRDGLMDIYVSNIAADYALHESHFVFINNGKTDRMEEGVAPFENESEKLGLSRSSWAWESKVADFNNDGMPEAIQATGFVKGDINRWPELQELATGNDEVLANPWAWPNLKPGDDLSGDAHIYLFARHESGRYFDIASQLDMDDAQITRGIAIADFNHDGKLDFVTANQWEASNVYENTGSAKNNFLGLAIQYPIQPNTTQDVVVGNYEGLTRPAIGAVAKLKTHNNKQYIAFVDGGNGHTGKSSNEIHFGLGETALDTKLDIVIEYFDARGIKKSLALTLTPGWHNVILPY